MLGNRLCKLSATSSARSNGNAAHAALPDLKNLQQAYQRAYKIGQTDILRYYQAWNNVTDKQLELLTLQLHLREARIGLDVAIGIYTL